MSDISRTIGYADGKIDRNGVTTTAAVNRKDDSETVIESSCDSSENDVSPHGEKGCDAVTAGDGNSAEMHKEETEQSAQSTQVFGNGTQNSKNAENSRPRSEEAEIDRLAAADVAADDDAEVF